MEPTPWWSRYDGPMDYQRLRVADRLAALVRIKFATYAEHVNEWSQEYPILMLWLLAPRNNRSEFELSLRPDHIAVSLRRTRRYPEEAPPHFDLRLVEEGSKAAGIHRKMYVAGTLGYWARRAADTDDIGIVVADHMEPATAKPGLPHSNHFVSDENARGNAVREGRLPAP